MFKSSSSEKIHCAFCKLSRRVYKKREVSIFDAVVLLMISGVFMLLVWGQPDKRSLILFGLLIFLKQVFIKVRWRESVKCPHCGFDPVLYNEDSELAAIKVKDFLAHRKIDPKFLLKPRPDIKPIIKKIQWDERSLALSDEENGPVTKDKRGVDLVL